MHTLSFAEQMALLRRRLAMPLPGIQAHLEMAPGHRQTLETLDVANKPCRKAGVLALLFPIENKTGVLLTKRRESLSQHAGQISFPGGRNEPDESLLETALRETHEEVGLSPDSIEILGALSPLYISVSNYCVFPFVGAAQAPLENLVPQTDEVQEILALPLAGLADPLTRQIEQWNLRGALTDIPFYGIAGETIWGATAMMLSELLLLFE